MVQLSISFDINMNFTMNGENLVNFNELWVMRDLSRAGNFIIQSYMNRLRVPTHQEQLSRQAGRLAGRLAVSPTH